MVADKVATYCNQIPAHHNYTDHHCDPYKINTDCNHDHSTSHSPDIPSDMTPTCPEYTGLYHHDPYRVIDKYHHWPPPLPDGIYWISTEDGPGEMCDWQTKRFFPENYYRFRTANKPDMESLLNIMVLQIDRTLTRTNYKKIIKNRPETQVLIAIVILTDRR